MRPWLVVAALGLAGCWFLAVHAEWPAVVLFGLAALLSMVSALSEASAATARHEAQLDADERWTSQQRSLEETTRRINAIDLGTLVQLQKDVEYLKTKDALGQV